MNCRFVIAVALLLVTAAPSAAQPASPSGANAHLQDCSCYDISVVDVGGNRRTTLLKNQGVRGWNVFDVSPNRRRILFSHPSLSVASITGRNKVVLFDGFSYFALWSPDGKKIAFGPIGSPSCRSGPLWVMNADGSEPHSVADCTLGVAWSPDSRRLAFASYSDRTGRVDVVNADGSGFRVLSTPATQISTITWSPHGDWIAYTLSRPHDTIHVVRADGLEEDTVGTGWFGSWSPDGRQIIYTHRDRNAPKGRINSIRIMNRDGKHGRVLVRGAVGGPLWSPNGRWIAYGRMADTPCACRWAWDAIRPAGTGQHRLVTLPRNSEVGPIYWSRDSARIVYLHAIAMGE